MQTACKTLSTLTAADLMTCTVVTIPKEMSIQGAAHLLAQHQISGAPVVDDYGRCIGVFSTTDVVYCADHGHFTATGHPHLRCAHSAWQVLDEQPFADDGVGRYMTLDPVTAPPTTPVNELARMMSDAHIHRVIIVDEQGRPTGVVSSMDVLAAVSRAPGGFNSPTGLGGESPRGERWPPPVRR
jgi:CBS-domain-containing membrane protein